MEIDEIWTLFENTAESELPVAMLRLSYGEPDWKWHHMCANIVDKLKSKSIYSYHVEQGVGSFMT